MSTIQIRVCDFCKEALKTDYYYQVIIDERTPSTVYTPWLHDATSFDVCKKCYLKIMDVKKNALIS